MTSSDRIRDAARVRVLVALVFFASTGRSAAQSYGLGDQVLTLGAAAFQPEVDDVPFQYHGLDGYIYGNGDSASYLAPLTLPDGAEVFQICLYANVPDASSDADSVFYVSKLVPGGQTPFFHSIPATLTLDNAPIGYGTFCTDVISYVFHDIEDVDSDGVPDLIAHVVRAHVSINAGFGGLRIFWRRQVRPPPGTATFNDVPTSDPGFQYVEALAASGITAGCGTNPPLYCPNGTVTRRQLAVFLARALGLHWPS